MYSLQSYGKTKLKLISDYIASIYIFADKIKKN